MSEPGAYVLGVDQQELERLRFQHKVWTEQAFALFRRGGLRAGQTVLDLGCGPGFTSLELAHAVGPTGRVIARDQSARFLEHLRAECARRGIAHVATSLGPVEDLALEPVSLDAAYSRWLFCWLPDPGLVLTRVAAALRPGGAVLLQEYLDWGAMKMIPHAPAFARIVAACLQSWREGEGTMDLADLVPDLAARAGLVVEHFAPVARVGAIGSLEWRWIGEFFASYPLRLVERGLLRKEEHGAHLAEWRALEADGTSFVLAPVMSDVVLRRPR